MWDNVDSRLINPPSTTKASKAICEKTNQLKNHYLAISGNFRMKGIKQPIFEDTWNIKIEKESMKPQIEDIWNIKMKTSQ